MQKPTEHWIHQGKKGCKTYVFYENRVLDLTSFMLEHPGGTKAIKNYLFKDVTNIIFEVYPHSRQHTHSTLLRYQIGCIPKEEVKEVRNKEDNLVEKKIKEKKKVCFNQAEEMKDRAISGSNCKSRSKSKGMKGSTKSTKTEATNKTSASRKGKKKEFLTSIKVISEPSHKSYDEYYKENLEKIKKQTSKPKGDHRLQQLESFVLNQIDQKKPEFKVPVLQTKLMAQL